jgi:hypothetical protein
MNADIFSQLPYLTPMAIEWAEMTSRDALSRGVELSDYQVRIAADVGVAHPEKIRLLTVNAIPRPEEGPLGQLAIQANLLGPQTIGLALGHAVFIRQGELCDRLLSHEFRHVYQYESAGSIGSFIPRYLLEIAQFGYDAAPFEIDARAHELQS